VKTSIFALLLLIYVGCSSCKKEIETRTYYLDQGIKDWMYFKKGTYWVYRDSVSGAIDSAWVDTSYINMVYLERSRNGLPNYHTNTETFFVEIKRTRNPYIYIYIYMSVLYTYRNYPSGILPGNAAFINESKYNVDKAAGVITSGNVFYYPPKNGIEADKPQTFYETYTVAGKEYKNVSLYQGYYICKNYGIIKIGGVLNTWELIRSNIVQ
jgi:hypothetical protein